MKERAKNWDTHEFSPMNARRQASGSSGKKNQERNRTLY
jgi:hypothetical protein